MPTGPTLSGTATGDRMALAHAGRPTSTYSSALGRSLVVLPTYNERENLELIVAAILSQAADLDVLIVDDNSPDGTGQIADLLAVETPGRRVHVLHRAGKQGLGTA